MKTDTYDQRSIKFTGVMTLGIVALWFVFALWTGAEGRFTPPPEKPPLLFGLTIMSPIVAFVLAYRRRGSFWAFCQTLDLKYVVAVNAWRILAIDFLLTPAEGRLPWAFALPAGIGDIITGLVAIPLAFSLANGTGVRKRFVAWSLFGLLDLVVALSMGILHSGGPIGILTGSGPSSGLMTELPRSMVPTFLVPMFILLHLLTFSRRKEVAAARATEPQNHPAHPQPLAAG